MNTSVAKSSEWCDKGENQLCSAPPIIMLKKFCFPWTRLLCKTPRGARPFWDPSRGSRRGQSLRYFPPKKAAPQGPRIKKEPALDRTKRLHEVVKGLVKPTKISWLLLASQKDCKHTLCESNPLPWEWVKVHLSVGSCFTGQNILLALKAPLNLLLCGTLTYARCLPSV